MEAAVGTSGGTSSRPGGVSRSATGLGRLQRVRKCVGSGLGRETESAYEVEGKARLESQDAEIKENEWAKLKKKHTRHRRRRVIRVEPVTHETSEEQPTILLNTCLQNVCELTNIYLFCLSIKISHN